MRLSSFVFSAIVALPAFATAQSIGDLPGTPELSPHATASQVVGVTGVSIDYSSPGVRDREIWGELVPYGSPWRAGANGPTLLTVESDFTFGGTDVPAGAYTVIITPQADSWTVSLSDADADVASATITPTEGPDRERLVYLFTDTTTDTTNLTLEWAGVTGSVEIGVDTASLVSTRIDDALNNAWRPHFNAARYYLTEGLDMEQAAEWMQQSVDIHATWWNHWFYALIRAELGQYDEARELAATAAELGAEDRVWNSFFAPNAETTIATWPR